jgi:hypothetical protein
MTATKTISAAAAVPTNTEPEDFTTEKRLEGDSGLVIVGNAEEGKLRSKWRGKGGIPSFDWQYRARIA